MNIGKKSEYKINIHLLKDLHSPVEVECMARAIGWNISAIATYGGVNTECRAEVAIPVFIHLQKKRNRK